MADDDSAMEPRENPEGTDHLPASGEVGSGKVRYHDPVTQPTDDAVDDDDDINPLQPSPGDAAGLS